MTATTADGTTWTTAVDAAEAEGAELVAEWAYPARRGQHAFTWRLYVADGCPKIASSTFGDGMVYNFWHTGGTVARSMGMCERSARRQGATRIL